MRVGIDLRLAAYRPGGIANAAVRLARELCAGGVDVVALQHRKGRAPLTACSTRWLWTPPHNRFEQAALAAELLPTRMDVLHSPDFIPPGIGWPAPYRRVVTVHDLSFRRFPEFLTRESLAFYSQLGRALAWVRGIAVDSEASLQDLEEHYPAARGRARVVYLAQDECFRPMDRKEAARAVAASGLPAEYVLWVGTLEPRKNLPGLFAAYARLTDPPPLVLAGQDGWLDRPWEALADEHGVRNRIVRFRPTALEDLVPVYNAARLVVMPSTFEGFGLPVLEAMACGVPVVCSNAGSLAELAGDAALTVAPDDLAGLAHAMEQALADTALRDGMRERGLAWAATFTWQRTAAQMLSIYQAAAA